MHKGLEVGQEGWISAPVATSLSTTNPVAAEGVTEPLTVTLAPTVIDVDDKFSVVADAVRMGDFQLASKFVTFTVPSPVAKS